MAAASLVSISALHDCALSFGIEYPTFGLGRAKTNDPTCDVLPNLSLKVPVGRNRFGIV